MKEPNEQLQIVHVHHRVDLQAVGHQLADHLHRGANAPEQIAAVLINVGLRDRVKIVQFAKKVAQLM